MRCLKHQGTSIWRTTFVVLHLKLTVSQTGLPFCLFIMYCRYSTPYCYNIHVKLTFYPDSLYGEIPVFAFVFTTITFYQQPKKFKIKKVSMVFLATNSQFLILK